MKLKHTMVLLAVCISVIFSGTYACANPVKGLFLYWRGETACAKGLNSGLKELNYNVSATEFNAHQDKGKLETFLNNLDPNQYDFIYTFGTTVSTMTAKKVTSTPILFGIVTNPVKAGLVNSWETSGNNVTGVSHAISYEDQVEFLLSLGSYHKIGMVYNPLEKNSQIALEELGAILKKAGVAFVAVPIDAETSIAPAVSNLVAQQPDLVYLPSDSFIQTHGETIISQFNESNIATYAALPKYIDAGALIGIVSSYHSVGMELAMSAHQVLKGKKPSAVPSKTLPMNMQTVRVNVKTAERIGTEIPYQILSVAELIE
jgi:putative tryptophan/tyrosine transport system substrate-binding protein